MLNHVVSENTGKGSAMMVIEKTCPGSRTIREPRPEYMACSSCGAEVEIWTDELKATCSKCGNKVYRAQQVSCIDWSRGFQRRFL